MLFESYYEVNIQCAMYKYAKHLQNKPYLSFRQTALSLFRQHSQFLCE